MKRNKTRTTLALGALSASGLALLLAGGCAASNAETGYPAEFATETIREESLYDC